MIDVREIDLLIAKSYLKEKGFDDNKITNELKRLELELNHSIQLKNKEGQVVKGPIFYKFKIGAIRWLGAFNGNRLVGIHYHSSNYHANDFQSELRDIMDGNLYADDEEVAIALDNKFKELIEDKFEVNYSYSFPQDQFDLEFRKKLGYTVWASANIRGGTLYYLKRLPGFKPISPEEEKARKIAKLKKQLEELNA